MAHHYHNSWNKICFTSGDIEVAINLPGLDQNTQGYVRPLLPFTFLSSPCGWWWAGTEEPGIISAPLVYSRGREWLVTFRPCSAQEHGVMDDG
jgi:hypothetical protein